MKFNFFIALHYKLIVIGREFIFMYTTFNSSKSNQNYLYIWNYCV